MMDPTLVQFFILVSKLINLQNPLLIMTEDEIIPLSFCNGNTFAIICSQYPAKNSGHLLGKLLDQTEGIKYYPILISEGDHEELIIKLREHPLLFTAAQVWVIPMEYSNKFPQRLDNNIFFFDGNSSAGYSVYESYAVKGKMPVTKMLFHWHQEEAIVRQLPSTMDRRSNLNGVVLRDSWLLNTRAQSISQRKSAGDIYEDILSVLKSRLNLTLQYTPPKPGRFGRKLKNGTWNGLVGMLTADDIDLVAGLMLSEDRASALDFAWPITYWKLTLYSSPSSSPRLNIWVYLNKFPLSAWVVVFATIIIAALCFSASCQETLSQSVTLMGRLFLQKGYRMEVKGLSSKALLLTAALCMKMVFIYYTRALTANMTASPKELRIKSFDDVERLGYQVTGMGPGMRSNDFLRHAHKDSAMRRIYENKFMPIETRKERDEIAEKMADGDLQETLLWTFGGGRVLQRLVAQEMAETVSVPKTLAFEKDSELTALFNHHICKMRESGVIQQILTRNSGEHNLVYGMEEAVVIGYQNILFPFAWLALGSIIAVAIVLAEIIIGWFRS